MKKSIGTILRKMPNSAFVDQPLQKLLELKKKREHVAFNSALQMIIPELKNFLQRRLHLAIKLEKIPIGKYAVDDLVNEVYVRAYNHLEEVQEEEHLYSWVFKNAEELLEELTIEEDFDQAFFQNIEEYTEQLWQEMEEEVTRDADGDLVLVEDLDDLSYPVHKYTLQDFLLVDEEEALLTHIAKAIDEEKMQKVYQHVLRKIPLPLRTIFDLSVIENFSAEEIAFIRNSEVSEVTKHLLQLKKGFSQSINRGFFKGNQT